MENSQLLYEQKSIKLGMITVFCAMIANFIPVMYLWIVKGIALPLELIFSIWALCLFTNGLSWVIQPITYFSMMGISGSYIGWVSGSVADLRAPSATMAQKVAGVEAGTPEGDVVSTIGVTGSVFVSVTLITIFTFIGAQLIPLLPTSVIKSFNYILPAVFGAVFADMASKNLSLGVQILIAAMLCVYGIKYTPIPPAVTILIVVVLGMMLARVQFVMQSKKGGK